MAATFGDRGLEQLYRRSSLVQTRIVLFQVLFVVSACCLLIAVIRVQNPDIILVVICLETIFAILLQVLLVVRPASIVRFVLYGTIQLVLLVAVSAFPAGHSAILPCIVVLFTLYALLPLELVWTIVISSVLSLAQLTSFLFIANPKSLRQFIGTVLLHVWTHFIGYYAYATRESVCRGAFLRARSAFTAEELAIQENAKFSDLLSTVVPSYLLHNVRQDLFNGTVKACIENHNAVTVVYGRLVGLEAVVSQCSVQDSAQMLNEFHSRIEHLAKKNGCIRIQSDCIVTVSGLNFPAEDHARMALHFACDLDALIKSFSDATSADVKFRCGIASGPLTTGIVGLSKWHYDIVGTPIEAASYIECTAPQNGIFLSDSTKKLIEKEVKVEKCQQHWKLEVNSASTPPIALLFPNLRRFSLVTVPQAVNRLLQCISSSNDTLLKTNGMLGRRKKKTTKYGNENEKSNRQGEEVQSLLNTYTLQFRNPEVENAYHLQSDRWFLPALAISILFLIVYGTYHLLVLPRQMTTLVMIVAALAIMFIVLLMLHIGLFQNFCRFIIQTSVAHSVAVLLILALLFVCGIVNTLSCPQGVTADITSECFVVHYSLLSCALWMLTAVIFIRFPSLALLCTLALGLLIYSLHIFLTHPQLYFLYSESTHRTHIEWELLTGLAALAAVIFINARRNEKIMRLEFMSKLKEAEEKTEAGKVETLKQQLLLNILPAHIAASFFTKSELHHHLCHSAGVAYLNILLDEEDGETAMCNLKNVVSVFDQILLHHRGIEKIRNCHKTYIVAVGVLPEISKNVHDPPLTIGDLLAELTQFALNVFAFAADHGIALNIGIDFGSVLSVVVSAEKPSYEIVGTPCVRARQLMQSADAYGIMVSEDIYLALRPRNFNFRSSPIKLPDNFNAYVFDDQNRRSDTESLSDDNAEETASPPAENPLQLFASMESSFSSDVYSIDIGVETESDMEWITPEMLEYERHAAVASTSALYTEESAPSRSEFSENDELKRRQGFHRTAHTAPLSGSNADNRYSQSSSRCLSPRQRRRRKFRSHNPSRDFTRSTYSELNRPYINGAERLAAAASRVDRMLEELEAVADLNAKVECQPFPLTTSVRSLRSLRRDLSSACHTEYDNADSEGICSDSEMIGSRLEELKNALRNEDSGRKRKRRIWGKMDTGNEADIDSVCSSITNSSIFEHLRWNSVHSIGYENEYEVASKEDLKALARDQMEALSRDIRRNFGDYHLSTFSDIEA